MNFHKLFIASFLFFGLFTINPVFTMEPASQEIVPGYKQIIQQFWALAEKAKTGHFTQEHAMSLLTVARKLQTAIDDDLFDLTGERFNHLGPTPTQAFGYALRSNAGTFIVYKPSVDGVWRSFPFTKAFRLNSMVKKLSSTMFQIGQLLENNTLPTEDDQIKKYPIDLLGQEACDPESQSYKGFISSILREELEPYEDLY